MRRSVRSHRSLRWAICLPLAGVLACGGGRAPVSASPATPPPSPPRITRVADGNTAAILLTSHNADLAAARIAATRAQHRDVKLLARNMVTDHTSMSARLSRLIASINLNPRDDDVSRLLRDQSAARRDTLRTLSGWAFDSTYVESEVRFHQDLLVAIDRVFLPSVRNASLKDYLTAMRPTIASHLALAEQVQATVAPPR
jgi:putative membrane protein